MEVFKLSVTCQKCKTVWQDDVLPEKTLGQCKCGATVFKVSRYKGYIYVMSTKSLRGSVKVGPTWSVPQRRRGLSNPAIPFNYVTLAYFGSSNPAKDEARVKEKLREYNLGKEHYRLEPSLAVAEIRTALSYRNPLYVLPRLRPKYEETLTIRREELERKMRGAKRKQRSATRPEKARRARGPSVGTLRSRAGVRGHAERTA